MALELQSRLVIDDEWLTRPGSYARYGVRDVWLWHPQVGVPGIVAEHGQPGWIYAADRHRLTALVGNGAPREQDWWDAADVEAFGPQWPAPPAGAPASCRSCCASSQSTRPGWPCRKGWCAAGTTSLPPQPRPPGPQAWSKAQPSALPPQALSRRCCTADRDRKGAGFHRRRSRLGRSRSLTELAARTRQGSMRIHARPPDTGPARQLHVCRACDVFLSADVTDVTDVTDDLDAHRRAVGLEVVILGGCPWRRRLPALVRAMGSAPGFSSVRTTSRPACWRSSQIGAGDATDPGLRCGAAAAWRLSGATVGVFDEVRRAL